MEQDCFVKRSEEEVRPGADFQAGFLFFITIECSQSVHFIVHDNRMFAERAFYCLIPESKGRFVVSQPGIL